MQLPTNLHDSINDILSTAIGPLKEASWWAGAAALFGSVLQYFL
jgi:uncharacterized membrane protein